MNAAQILAKYWATREYPVDPYIIAYENDIQIINNPNLKDKDIAGKIYKKDNGQVAIEVNPWQTPYRQRFTVAHELGHYFLGHDLSDGLNRVDTITNLSNPTDKIETQANSFAAELLMPREFIEHILYEQQISDIDKIADMLQVSRLALGYRLKNLGLI